MKSIEEQVIEILADELGYDTEDVTPNANLEVDLNADSLDVTEIVMALEDKFDIEVADDDVDKIRTVGDVIKLVERLKPAAE
jgi:acyl carrier protein